MMTLREPISLRAGITLTGPSESFCQRLTGNYALMTAHIAPKDLLFLLTAPPELPDDLGGVTSLNLQNSLTEVRSVTMEVVNHIVNRILLENHPQFTYQDQVYLDTALRKLGVTDSSRFMEEVRRLRDEQRSQSELTRLYSNEVTQKALAALELRREPSRPGENAPEEPQAAAAPARYYLHEEIYNRLRTGDIYREVGAYQQTIKNAGDSVSNNEFKLLEQLRVSQSLHLEELKQHSVFGTSLTLRHHSNLYELGALLPPPATEEQVLAQASEAALLATVDKAVTHTLHRYSTDGGMWLQLTKSLSQTAENTLSRFEIYHSEALASREENSRFSEWSRTLEQREQETLRSLTENWRQYEQLRQERHAAATPGSTARFPTLEYRAASEEALPLQEREQPQDQPQPGLSGPELAAAARRLLADAAAPAAGERRQKAETARAEGFRERLLQRERELYLTSRREAETLRELAGLAQGAALLQQEEKALPPGSVSQLLTGLAGKTPLPQETAGQPAPLPPVERVLAGGPVPEGEAEQRESDQPKRQTPAEAPPFFPAPSGEALPTQATTVRREGEHTATEILREFRRQTETTGEAATATPQATEPGEPRPLHLTSPSAGPEEEIAAAAAEASGEDSISLLQRELREIDHRNRERYERLQELQSSGEKGEAPARPDPKRTMAEALRAMEQPGAVLRELLEGGEPPAPASAVPPQVEQILRQADPATRQVYETLLQYQRDPDSVAEGIIQHTNVGAFNAEAARQQAGGAVELQHPSPAEGGGAAEERGQKQGGLLESLYDQMPSPPLPPSAAHRKAPIVFRREDVSYLDELVERLEERRTQSVTAMQPLHTERLQQSSEETRSSYTNKLATQTTEDITALVNQTMARQMNTITDKVYRQMERRLQSERNRRGRF